MKPIRLQSKYQSTTLCPQPAVGATPYVAQHGWHLCLRLQALRLQARRLQVPPLRGSQLSCIVFGIIFLLPLFSDTSALALPGETVQQTSKRWHSLGIIDIHGHIGHFQGFAIGKETLIANVEKYGIKTCLVSNIDCANMPGLTANLNPEQANAKTVELVESNPETFRGLLWVRPTTQDLNSARHFLEMRTGALSQKRLFVGMKFHPEFDHYPADDKSVDGFLDLCAANGVPAVFHCGQPGSNSDAARIYLAAKRHPKVPIVLYHMGFRSDHSSAIEIVASACKNKDANLYLETSQCPPEIVLSAIKSVGASRVLFGTDATYYGYNHYEAYIPMLDLLQQKLSPVDFNRVIRDNATKLFPL